MDVTAGRHPIAPKKSRVPQPRKRGLIHQDRQPPAGPAPSMHLPILPGIEILDRLDDLRL